MLKRDNFCTFCTDKYIAYQVVVEQLEIYHLFCKAGDNDLYGDYSLAI